MTRIRWAAAIAVVLVLVAGVGVAMSQRGGEHESAAQRAAEHDGDNPAMEADGGENEANDPDRNAAAHVGSKPGYERHNNVVRFATAAATGWVGESKLAVEDTWEPTVAADPNAPYVYAMYNRYGVSCPKSSCPNPADDDPRLQRRRRQLGRRAPALHLHQGVGPVGPGAGDHQHRSRLRRLDELQHDRLLEVDRPRLHLDDADHRVGQQLVGQAVDGNQRQRPGHLHRLGEPERVLRDLVAQRRRQLVDPDRAQLRQQCLPAMPTAWWCCPTAPPCWPTRSTRAAARSRAAPSTSRSGAPPTAAPAGRETWSTRCRPASTSARRRPRRWPPIAPARW